MIRIMEQYIPKSALVAEIERRLDELYDLLPDASKVENGSITTSEACNTGKYTALESFRNYIDILEVKEVDLKKEYKDFVEEDLVYNKLVNGIVGKAIAKHFFELGLKAKGEIYVVTRSEEHSDYVEAVFLSENKAEEYCNPFNENENCYARHITKVKIQ